MAFKRKSSFYSVLLTLTAFALAANALPPLATTMAQQFAIPYDAFGYIFMLQYLCFSCASLAGGYVQHCFGISNRVLVLGGVLSTALLLMAGNLLSSFLWVVFWIIPLGFAGGLTETFSSIMVAEFEQEHSSRLMNLSQVFYCAGAIVAPQLIAILLEIQRSWSTTFFFLGLCVLGIGVVFMIFNRPALSPAFSSALPHPEESSPPPIGMALRRDRLFYVMASLLFLYVVIEISSASWIAAYFEKIFHLSAGVAARRLSLFWVGLILGRSAMVIAPARLTLWPALIGGTVGMCVGNTLLVLSRSDAIAAGAVLIYGIAAGPVWPVIVTLSQHIRRSARFTSGVIGIGALGAALGPFLSSLVIRSFGLPWFFPFLALSSLLLLVLILLAKSVVRKTTWKAVPASIVPIS